MINKSECNHCRAIFNLNIKILKRVITQPIKIFKQNSLSYIYPIKIKYILDKKKYTLKNTFCMYTGYIGYLDKQIHTQAFQ